MDVYLKPLRLKVWLFVFVSVPIIALLTYLASILSSKIHGQKENEELGNFVNCMLYVCGAFLNVS